MKTVLVIAALLFVSFSHPLKATNSRGSVMRVGITILPAMASMVGQSPAPNWHPQSGQSDAVVNGFDVRGLINFENDQEQAVVVMSKGRVVSQLPMLPRPDIKRLARCEHRGDHRQAVALVDEHHDTKLKRDSAHAIPGWAWWVSPQGEIKPVDSKDVLSLLCEIRIDPTSAAY